MPEMTPPKISVCLCTYNGEKYLREQIDSILNQTYTNIELIICDDKSTDNTVNILEEYKKQPGVFIYLNKNNLGYTSNFEKAISLATGDYIALADQDDIWLPQKLEILSEGIGNYLLIYSDSEYIDKTGKPLGKYLSNNKAFVKGKFPLAFLFDNCISGHTVMFKKEIVSKITPFPKKFFHDWWLGFTASAMGSITFVDQPLVYYRFHENNVTDLLGGRDTPKDKGSREAFRKSKIHSKLSQTETILQFPFLTNTDRQAIKKIEEGYQERLQSWFFSFKLFNALYSRRQELYLFKKSKGLSLWVHIFKESLGEKLKDLFYKWKNKLV